LVLSTVLTVLHLFVAKIEEFPFYIVENDKDLDVPMSRKTHCSSTTKNAVYNISTVLKLGL
jgi:hypothetical protein